MTQLPDILEMIALRDPDMRVRDALDLAYFVEKTAIPPMPEEGDYEAGALWASRHEMIMGYVRDGRPINAIKEFRAETRHSLYHAKYTIELLREWFEEGKVS